MRGSNLEEGPSQGLPVRSRHVGDAMLSGNLTRRVDLALFMVVTLTNSALVREAPGDRRPPRTHGTRRHRDKPRSCDNRAAPRPRYR